MLKQSRVLSVSLIFVIFTALACNFGAGANDPEAAAQQTIEAILSAKAEEAAAETAVAQTVEAILAATAAALAE